MIIPHGPGSTKQINIHLSHIVLFMLAWTAITGWGSYLSAQHIEYWRTQLSNQVLKLKINFLVSKLDQTSRFIDEVKQLEAQLRHLLQYNNEAALIQELAPQKDQPATGGPTLGDQKDLTRILKGLGQDMSWNRLIEKTGFLKSEAMARIDNYKDLTNYIETKRRIFRATPRGWPCAGAMTSHFGMRNDPFSANEEFHAGVDIASPSGTAVHATADGRVRIAAWHSGYGNLVVLEHEYGYTTRYGHNSKLLVKHGDLVKRGQVIGLSGMTGRASGPHVHYEVWRYSSRQNPYSYLRALFPKFNSHTKSVSKKDVQS